MEAMFMREFLLYLLRAVIIAAVPVVTVFLCNFLQKKKEEIKQKMTSETQKRLLDEAMEAVTTAVIKTNQTYVDALKESNTFSLDNQGKAFKKSMDTATEIMRQEVKDFISSEYGDLNKWLDTQIEATVNTVKAKK